VTAPPCPNCASDTGRWLEGSSKDAYVDYYRCGECGHVWNTPKTIFKGQEVNPTPVAVPCPECGANKTDCLSDLSAMAEADFLRCGVCLHVWTHPRAKGEPPCDLEPRSA
jgi:uncharacterized Zn finger protein